MLTFEQTYLIAVAYAVLVGIAALVLLWISNYNERLERLNHQRGLHKPA